MDDDGIPANSADLYTAFMEAEPAARPLLRRFFFAHATRDWATEVPGPVMVQAATAMNAMHRAMERGDYAEALAQLRVWAGLLGVAEGDAPPE